MESNKQRECLVEFTLQKSLFFLKKLKSEYLFEIDLYNKREQFSIHEKVPLTKEQSEEDISEYYRLGNF